MKSPLALLCFSLMAILPSCKNGNPPKEAAPAVEVNNQVSLTPKQDDGYIGLWTIPVTNQITTSIRLYFDANAGVYYTKEKESNSSKQDSLVVVVKKKNDSTYAVEYAKTLEDNYVITGSDKITWRCPGYADVKCGGNIDMDKLASTYEQYKSSTAPKPTWGEAKQLSSKEKADFYEWSKQYVRMSVVESESLVFPNISAVRFLQKEEKYRVEYKVSGKDLYKNNVTYPISILFEKDEKGNPTFLSIATE